jgi:hypothetical protein
MYSSLMVCAQHSKATIDSNVVKDGLRRLVDSSKDGVLRAHGDFLPRLALLSKELTDDKGIESPRELRAPTSPHQVPKERVIIDPIYDGLHQD